MVCRAGEKIQVCAILFTMPFEANHKFCTRDRISLFVSTRVKDLYNYIEKHYHIRADNFKLFLFTSCKMVINYIL